MAAHPGAAAACSGSSAGCGADTSRSKALAVTDTLRPPTPRPHLIHVGYAKSGSSFLRHWFKQHPQIGYRHGRLAGLSRPMELLETPADIRLRVTSSEAFASPMLSTETPEPGAFSAAQAAVCENLADLFPNAFILIVTRGYRSMIMSSYSQYVRSGGAISLEELIGNAQAENPWDYDRLVAMYRRCFGADKVMVLPWELLRDRPDDFVRQIEQRFGLDHQPPPPQRVNSSLTPAEMRWYPRLSALIGRAPVGERGRKALARRFARLSHRNRFSGMIRLLQKVAPAPPVSVDLLPSHVVEVFRGKAASLAAEPLFVPYAA